MQRVDCFLFISSGPRRSSSDLNLLAGCALLGVTLNTHYMETHLEDGPIVQKTRELCETILQQPQFQSIRSRIDQFLNDESAKSQFDALNEKGEFLHHKQHQGVQLTEAEIADFQKDRDAVLANPVIRNFLDAQHEVHNIQETVSQYVGKTFELGRLPQASDFDSESCGPGCGCGH